MNNGFFEYYIIIANIIGFILFAVDSQCDLRMAKKPVEVILVLASLLGGSAGVLLSILLFNRKAEKENMMSRVFIACMFVIQLVIFLIIKGHVAGNITLDFL